MKRNQYLKRAFNLYNSGGIDDETYDSMICNIDDFTDSEEELEGLSKDYFD